MKNMNIVVVDGNTTKVPEMKVLPSGTATATFDIAVNDDYKDKNGDWVKQSYFFKVSVFGDFAKQCAENFKTSTRVVVSGKLVQKKWKAKDGTNRDSIEIVADKIIPAGDFPKKEEVKTNEDTPDEESKQDDIPF